MLLSALPAALGAEYGPTVEDELVLDEPPAAVDTGATGCTDLYLQDGVQLPDLPLFFVRTQPDSSWGSQEMVDLLVESARHMAWLLPESSPIVIGDISQEHGGFLSGHKSHRGGVDADVGIYRRGARQNPRGFDTLAPSELDVEATWALISTMLDTGRVDMILLDRSHIARLREYTLRAGLLTPAEALDVFPAEGTRGTWEKSGIIRHAQDHKDHLHVRVLCSDGSKASGD
jgi:murein endopeptidase